MQKQRSSPAPAEQMPQYRTDRYAHPADEAPQLVNDVNSYTGYVLHRPTTAARDVDDFESTERAFLMGLFNGLFATVAVLLVLYALLRLLT